MPLIININSKWVFSSTSHGTTDAVTEIIGITNTGKQYYDNELTKITEKKDFLSKSKKNNTEISNIVPAYNFPWRIFYDDEFPKGLYRSLMTRDLAWVYHMFLYNELDA